MAMFATYDRGWSDDARDRDSGRPDISAAVGSDPRERNPVGTREVFTDHVNLPRGVEPERVHVREHDYSLRGSESPSLATVGAFGRLGWRPP
jgi:CO/xanthine dehydrogenase Mo-binding subunit